MSNLTLNKLFELVNYMYSPIIIPSIDSGLINQLAEPGAKSELWATIEPPMSPNLDWKLNKCKLQRVKSTREH